ncbi:DNA-binding transcriptional LysR family regulator [Rhodococcus sp. UYP5]
MLDSVEYHPEMDEYLLPHVEIVAPLLAAFDVAATEGHITRAADKLGVPQSSLSRRLKTLEKTLGIALFQPVGRGVTLTSAGRELFERTHDAIRKLDDAITVVRADADPSSGFVRFGFPLTLGPVGITTILAEFHETAPRIRVHLVQAHGEALAHMIRDGRLDIAVVIPPPADLTVTVLGSQHIRLHVARTNALAGRSEVAIAELADEPFIASPPSFHLRSLLDSWCTEAGFTPRVPFEISEIDTIRALVGHDLGVALLPGESEHFSVVAVRLSGSRDRDVGLVTGNHRPTAAVSRFTQYVVENRHRIAAVQQ